MPEEDILIQRWSKCSLFFFQTLYRVAQKSCYTRSNILNRECPVTQHATTCNSAPPFWQNFRWTATLFLNFASVCIKNTFFLTFNSKLQPTKCNVSWFIYFYRRSTCFGRFLRPSSGAHNCTYSFRYCQLILLLAARAAVLVDNTWSCMYSYVLLMMGRGTAWNM